VGVEVYILVLIAASFKLAKQVFKYWDYFVYSPKLARLTAAFKALGSVLKRSQKVDILRYYRPVTCGEPV
jgi:hypothetical protein